MPDSLSIPDTEALAPLPPEVGRFAAFFARLFRTGKVYTSPLQIGVEYRIPGEAEATQGMTKMLGDLVRGHLEKGDSQRRAVHTKQTAFVRGTLEIPSDLDPELRVGLFATPGSHSVRVRYSNASPTPKADSAQDIRGMAIKVLDVVGDTVMPGQPNQDFLLITGEVLIAKDAVEFLALTDAQLGPSPNSFFGFKTIRLWDLLAGLSIPTPIGATVADFRYWSAVPYQFGPGRAVKYSIQPRYKRVGGKRGEEFRPALAARLKGEEVLVDLFVQFQTDPHRMPIEDPTVRWSESLSKPRQVATLRLQPQDIDDAEMIKEGEATKFSPWHCLAPHRPLGSINRARRSLYEALQALRSP
jgi:hypothetical protein